LKLLQLDWRAYFKQFCAEHGGTPLEHQGKLLFPDGWTYAKDSYAGPEFPPPENELAKERLIYRYYLKRLRILRQEHTILKRRIAMLEQEQINRSAPMQQTISYRGEGGKQIKETGPLDLVPMRSEVKLMQQDIMQCLEKLRSKPSTATS